MKKRLILLPILMMALAACGETTSDSTSTGKPSQSTSTSEPSVDTSVSVDPQPSTSVSVQPSGEFGIVDTPDVGQALKLGMYQANLDKTLYFKGEMSGYYFATVEDASEAADVYLEAADTGYHMYFNDATNAKKYIEIEKSGTHNNVVFKDAAVHVWEYKAEWKTMILTYEDNDQFYLGTYNTYNTISASKIDKAPTSFVSHFYAKDATGELPVIVFHVTAINGTDVEVEQGKQKAISLTFEPTATTEKQVTYVSDNDEIATVNEDGLVTGVAVGTCNITVTSTANPEVTTTIKVTVSENSGVVVDEQIANYNFVGALAGSVSQAKGLSTSDDVLAIFKTESDLMPLSFENIVKVYAGANGGSGATQYVNRDVLKLGSSSAVGSLTINFAADVKISKVTVTMAGWYAESELTINGMTKSPNVKMAGDVTPAAVDYELATPTNVLSLATTTTGKPSMVIFGIAVTYTK